MAWIALKSLFDARQRNLDRLAARVEIFLAEGSLWHQFLSRIRLLPLVPDSLSCC